MKTQYTVDLADLMRLYETNYARLMPLLPKSDEVGAKCIYRILNHDYHLTITESTRYTTLVELKRDNEMDESVDYMISHMVIRLYHDARVAEVCSAQQISRFKPRYDYPNLRMLQQDEKHQINRFLRDWLSHCLRFGLNKNSVY